MPSNSARDAAERPWAQQPRPKDVLSKGCRSSSARAGSAATDSQSDATRKLTSWSHRKAFRPRSSMRLMNAGWIWRDDRPARPCAKAGTRRGTHGASPVPVATNRPTNHRGTGAGETPDLHRQGIAYCHQGLGSRSLTSGITAWPNRARWQCAGPR